MQKADVVGTLLSVHHVDLRVTRAGVSIALTGRQPVACFTILKIAILPAPYTIASKPLSFILLDAV